MGDTGSLALGGLFAAMSIATHTEFLAIILGGLFVIETMSDIIQVGYFKMTHKRVFKMAPIHHHFELKGWPEVKVVVRFWMIEMLFRADRLGAVLRRLGGPFRPMTRLRARLYACNMSVLSRQMTFPIEG